VIEDAGPPSVDFGRATLWATSSQVSEGDEGPLGSPVVFRPRPAPVPARHRFAYRTSVLVLTLGHFNRQSAKVANLHLLTWAMRSSRTRSMFSNWWAGRRYADTVTSRIDPELDVTLNLALVDGLIEPLSDRSRVRLSGKGSALAKLIEASEDTLLSEKAFLSQLPALSDTTITRRLGSSF
jgi:hypothetical protein